MKIKSFSKIKSLLRGNVTPIEITIKIDLTFVKELSKILADELNRLGFLVEAKSCRTIVANIMDALLQKQRDQEKKD